MISKQKGVDAKADFRLRILRLEENYHEILGERACDDLFILSNKPLEDLKITDVNVERLGFDNFQELKFVFGMSEVYE